MHRDAQRLGGGLPVRQRLHRGTGELDERLLSTRGTQQPQHAARLAAKVGVSSACCIRASSRIKS